MVVSSNKKIKSSDLEAKTQKSGLKTQTSKQNVKVGISKSNEKKDPSKNGTRKSLAVNGYTKLAETRSTEKIVAVKVEGANSSGNKRRNRKRSLSQPGAESVSKIPKLEKFAGTAFLDSDKKEKADKKNRANKPRPQTKEKRKSVAKSNKMGIKQKILEGDIEAQRNIQAKLDALIRKPVAERSNSTRRKIRHFQSLLKIKSKVAAGSDKPLTVTGKVQKAAQKKKGSKLEIQQVVKTEALPMKKEEPQSDDDNDSNKSKEDLSDEGDFELPSAESGTEEGSDEEDSDFDENDSDLDENDSEDDEENDSEDDEEYSS